MNAYLRDMKQAVTEPTTNNYPTRQERTSTDVMSPSTEETEEQGKDKLTGP